MTTRSELPDARHKQREALCHGPLRLGKVKVRRPRREAAAQ
jgi:hypothetical protein